MEIYRQILKNKSQTVSVSMSEHLIMLSDGFSMQHNKQKKCASCLTMYDYECIDSMAYYRKSDIIHIYCVIIFKIKKKKKKLSQRK